MPRCSSQQQAEQESSPTLGTSVLRAMPAPESRGLTLAAVAQLRGVVGLQDHRKPWRRILMPGKVYLWCCGGVFFGAGTGACAQLGTGAPGPTPPPPGFTSQPARQARPARPARSGAPCNAGTALPELQLSAGSPLSKAHPMPGACQLGTRQSWLARGHHGGTGASLPHPTLCAGAVPKPALFDILPPGCPSA